MAEAAVDKFKDALIGLSEMFRYNAQTALANAKDAAYHATVGPIDQRTTARDDCLRFEKEASVWTEAHKMAYERWYQAGGR